MLSEKPNLDFFKRFIKCFGHVSISFRALLDQSLITLNIHAPHPRTNRSHTQRTPVLGKNADKIFIWFGQSEYSKSYEDFKNNFDFYFNHGTNYLQESHFQTKISIVDRVCE